MSAAPRGASIQELYVWHRDKELFWVNRRYQRKLVWTRAEKQKLIDSILSGYPLPLILLAGADGSGYEIIDGMQRLNAIFSFIETGYPLESGEYFDLKEFASARQAGEKGRFQAQPEPCKKLPGESCAKLLNYQMPLTVFADQDEEKINEVFSRINSGGRQLSNQERRQAGIVSVFSDLTRDISSEIRGDSSRKKLKLQDMPSISIDTAQKPQGYSINAEETFWLRHGILAAKQLRQSEDEDLIADILASILLERPLARSKEVLDSIYTLHHEMAEKIKASLRRHQTDFLKEQVIAVLSHIDAEIKKYSPKPRAFRKRVMGEGTTASSAKTPFYSVFMAFYELMAGDSKFPRAGSGKIIAALQNLNKKLETQTHHATSEQRKANINTVKGLIQDFFVKKEPSQLFHGPGLAIDFENSLRRSRIETPRYEMKQGFLSLDKNRQFEKSLVERLAQTACAMANIGPESRGFIQIGVADQKKDADRAKELDSIEPVPVNSHWVVGVDREARKLGKTVEKYVDMFVSEFKKIPVSEDLKRDILSDIDTVNYRGFSVIRIAVKPQSRASYVNNECFIREGSHTKKAEGPAIEAVISRFNKRA